MPGPKTVKRYANRKLYDTERSCYVTLDDIAGMIKTGEEVRVIDNKSGEDLTSVTLAQIIFEAEKKKSFMPLGLLRDLVQGSGETLGQLARERVDKVQAKASELREAADKLRHEWEHRLDRVITRKTTGGEGGDGGAFASTKHLLTDWVATTQKMVDDLQKGVEERVKGGVGAVTVYANLGREIDEIRKRLAQVESRLGKLQE
ncbi:MAG: polyhydroxyalkanoate synthesis regulator DNA-binding domain-containing protein [Myxococcota bacterium]